MNKEEENRLIAKFDKLHDDYLSNEARLVFNKLSIIEKNKKSIIGSILSYQKRLSDKQRMVLIKFIIREFNKI